MSDYSHYIARATEIRDQAIAAGITCPHAIAALILGETIAIAIEQHVGDRLERLDRTITEAR